MGKGRRSDYYSANLSGERLRRCYEIAPPRVKRYLDAEIQFVASMLQETDTVLELGCGYGRVARELAKTAHRVVGVDTSRESLELGRRLAVSEKGCEFVEMDASSLAFEHDSFDVVVCVQNGICAFGIDQRVLLSEALRVARPGGSVVCSTYSPQFWPDRLAWFEAQAAEGLVGEIDYERTREGTIVCRDGFSAGTVSVVDFLELGHSVGLEPELVEVDRSSLFAVWRLPAAAREAQ